jgi:flotillin
MLHPLAAVEIAPSVLETLTSVGIVGGSVIGILLLVLFFVKSFLIIGRPNELLVFSGRQRTLEDGSQVGFRIIRGGRSVRIPILEQVDRMDLTTMPIDIKIRGAYSKGNIPVNVDAVANAKITTDSTTLKHAIERFLGIKRTEIRRVAKETLEGTLRGVIAQLTPEELNHERQKLSDILKSEVDDDFSKLGLMVDTFRIQQVSDDTNYLDSISRIRIAEVLRDAEIAESDAKREADRAIADAEANARVAQENAEAAIIEKENDLKRLQAELDAEAKSEEERTTAASREARAVAEPTRHAIRSTLEELRLRAEQVIPAEMNSQASQLKAAGDAFIKEETGRAEGDSLNALYQAWKAAGGAAKEVFLIQQIDRILEEVAKVTDGLEIANVNIIDGGDGQALAGYVGAYPAIVIELLEKIRQTVGIDVVGVLASQTRGGSK